MVSALDSGSRGPGSCPGRVIVLCSWAKVACVAGVQRGGRGEVECEREARRELNASAKRDESATKARSLGALAFNFPPPSPLYAGHAG